MSLPDKIFKPERYTYKDYLLWQGDWELVNGYPFAMCPSPTRTHQQFSKLFIKKIDSLLEKNDKGCDCETFYELDWVVDNDTIVRPDCIVVCGKFNDDFLNFAPTLIVEICSPATKLRDRNTKYNLYELKGVKYYFIIDTDKKKADIFELKGKKYVPKKDTKFNLTSKCFIDFDIDSVL
jgi:Uma2 family endonuclease